MNDPFWQIFKFYKTKNRFWISYTVSAVCTFEIIQIFLFLNYFLTWFYINFVENKMLGILKWTLSYFVCKGATITISEWFVHGYYGIFFRKFSNLLTNGRNSVTIKLKKFFLWTNSSFKFHVFLNSLLTCDSLKAQSKGFF